MTNQEILQIAMNQSAEDIGCRADDFRLDRNVVTAFRLGKNARKYLKEPITGCFVSYGNNIVAAVTDEIADLAAEYIGKYAFYHCFETPNLHWLNERLTERGYKVCYMAEYFLPDVGKMLPLSRNLRCATDGVGRTGAGDLAMRLLAQDDFRDLYVPEWGNALCADRPHLDVLGVGAYDGDRLVALAACSADCAEMWQIGVDVLPEYRRRGIASALTSALAEKILKRDKVPFYCSAWSNVRSAGNAVKSGFVPAWVEMSVKPVPVVDEVING